MKTKLYSITFAIITFFYLSSCNPRAETPAPIACFQPSANTVNVNQTVAFDASCSQDVEAFGWSFGDGTTGANITTSHSFNKPGSYEVRLKVYNKNLTDETSETILVVDSESSPKACFTMSSTSVSPGESINFTNCSENADEYLWDFGDDNTSTQENPSHSYANEGEYTITLTASTGNLSDDVSKTVTVTATNQVDPRNYGAITQWDDHYYTDFNDDGGFFVGTAEGGEYTCSLIDSKYKVEVTDTNYNWVFTNTIAELPAESENYDIEMTLTLEKDGFWEGSGFAWAKSDDPFNFIFYVIDIEGYYILGDNVNGYWMENWVQKGELYTNKLTIRKFDDKYYFFINEELVEEFDFIEYFGSGFGLHLGANSTTLIEEYGIWTTTQTKKSAITKPKARVPVKTTQKSYNKPIKVSRNR